MPFYKMWSSSNAHAGGLYAACLELCPWPSTVTVASWGRRLGVNQACRLGSADSRYTTDTYTGFR